jgi:hypothetical protein
MRRSVTGMRTIQTFITATNTSKARFPISLSLKGHRNIKPGGEGSAGTADSPLETLPTDNDHD